MLLQLKKKSLQKLRRDEGERFLTIVLLIALAYTYSTIQGQQIKRKKIQKYVARIKESGRSEQRHSSFYVGLYGQTWVNFKDISMELVTELMKLNRNKLKYYQSYETYIIYVLAHFVAPSGLNGRTQKK